MKDLSRRKMIQLGGGAVALGGSVALCGTPAGFADDHDLIAMIEELDQIDVSYSMLQDPDTEGLARALWDREWKLIDRIVATPAEGPRGVAAKLRSFCDSRACRAGRYRPELMHAALDDLDRFCLRDL